MKFSRSAFGILQWQNNTHEQRHELQQRAHCIYTHRDVRLAQYAELHSISILNASGAPREAITVISNSNQRNRKSLGTVLHAQFVRWRNAMLTLHMLRSHDKRSNIHVIHSYIAACVAVNICQQTHFTRSLISSAQNASNTEVSNCSETTA